MIQHAGEEVQNVVLLGARDIKSAIIFPIFIASLRYIIWSTLPLVTNLSLQFWGTGTGKAPQERFHGGPCLPSLAEGELGPDSGVMCEGSGMLGPGCRRTH